MVSFWGSRTLTKRKCVGVVGLLQAGKTVLLTSLIDHLKKHEPARLPLDRAGTQITELMELPPLTGAEPFPYDEARSALGHRTWPPKTVRPQEYRALYVRDDWRYTKIDLSLLDIPGERLADMVIAGCPRFEAWSDTLLRLLRASAAFAEQTQPFFALLDDLQRQPAKPIEASALLHAYRLVLARLITSCMPIVTPSSFLIDASGAYVASDVVQETDPARLVETLAQRQHSGLSAAQQFAPLPPALRQAHPALAQCFASHYRAYRQQLVMPFANALKACDTLLILVDVAMLLEGGVGMLNANLRFLQQIVSYVDPGFTAFGTFGNVLLRLATFGFVALRGVKRIAFVATKADRVWQDDRSKLEGLLRDMTAPLVRGHQAVKHLQVDYMVCAAVDATRSDVQGQTHALQFKAPDGATLRQTVPQLPEHWPDQWEALAYTFPNPLPWMPENRNNPPDHINLHRIAELVLS